MKKIILITAALLLGILLCSCKAPVDPVVTDDPTILPDPVVTDPITDPVTSPVTDPVTDPITDPVTEPVQNNRNPGDVLGEGFVISNTGTKLNILLNWKAVQTDHGTAKITVSAYLECYSIYVGPRDDAVISVGDTVQIFKTPSIEIGGPAFNEILLGTFEFDIEKSDKTETSLPVYLEWKFFGTYAGVPLDYVIINDTITFTN